MRIHHACFGELNAYTFKGEQLVEQKVHARVGERRIAHSRSNALVGFGMGFFHGELLIWRISPIHAAHIFVHLFCRPFSQAVGQHL